MVNGIRTGDPCGFNKGRSSKFREGSRVRQTPEEGRRTYRPKRCGNYNKDEGNSPKTLNDKNQINLFKNYLYSIDPYEKSLKNQLHENVNIDVQERDSLTTLDELTCC